MTTSGLNLFIVDDSPDVAESLRSYLNNRFGNNLSISTFISGAEALQSVDKETGIVILDFHLVGEDGNKTLEAIKAINPNTEVIMLSSNEDVGLAIDAFRKGASDVIIKGKNSNRKLHSVIYGIVTYPVRVMEHDWGINKYVAMFLLTFAGMGIGVFIIVQLFYKTI
ncbi:MAG: response regulator [Bacteroidia bacterium]